MNTKEPDESKIGAGHAQAMFRQGLNELRNAVYPDSNVAQRYPEQGLYGTATPQEVMDSKRAEGPGAEQEKDSILNQHLRVAEMQPTTEARGRDMEMER